MAHQIFEQGIFLQGEVDPLAAPSHFARGRVQCQIVDLEHAGTLGGAAAKQGANSGEQFVDGEGLGEVIVRSCVKTLDALIYLRLSGQNQNGGLNPCLADALENFQSGQRWQHQVDDQ